MSDKPKLTAIDNIDAKYMKSVVSDVRMLIDNAENENDIAGIALVIVRKNGVPARVFGHLQRHKLHLMGAVFELLHSVRGLTNG